ncbi:hypothetical protein ISCGN_018613 [Ixodes scapularis]
MASTHVGTPAFSPFGPFSSTRWKEFLSSPRRLLPSVKTTRVSVVSRDSRRSSRQAPSPVSGRKFAAYAMCLVSVQELMLKFRQGPVEEKHLLQPCAFLLPRLSLQSLQVHQQTGRRKMMRCLIILLSIASSDGAHMLDELQDATKLIVLEPTTGKQWFLGPILVDFKLGALRACQHWSSATMPLQKPLSNASRSRHATTAMKERSDIFLLQIILLSIASSDGAHMLDEPQDATKLIVLEPTTGKQWFLGPILVDFKLGALGACQHWSSATMPLQKPLSHASHSRHATTAMKERSDIFLLQVL